MLLNFRYHGYKCHTIIGITNRKNFNSSMFRQDRNDISKLAINDSGNVRSASIDIAIAIHVTVLARFSYTKLTRAT